MLWIGSKEPPLREASVIVGVDRDPPHHRIASIHYSPEFVDRWVAMHLSRGPTPTFFYRINIKEKRL